MGRKLSIPIETVDQMWRRYAAMLIGDWSDREISSASALLHALKRRNEDVPSDRRIVRQFKRDNPVASEIVIVQVLRAAIASGRPTPPKSAA